MSSKTRFPLLGLNINRFGYIFPVFALFSCGHAWGACDPTKSKYQDIDIQCAGGNGPAALYDNPGGTPITDTIELCPAPPATTSAVTWTFEPGAGGSPGGP